MSLYQLITSDELASELFAARQDDECAARCNLIATATHQPTGLLTDRGLYQALGPVMAETILQKLSAYAQANQAYSLVVARFLRWLEPTNQGVDFGDPALLQLLDALTLGGLLTGDESAAIKAISLKKPVYTAAQVERLRIGAN